MRCTGYEMARYKGTQASHLYEKSMHTLCSLNYPRLKSITHLRTFSDNGVYVALQLFTVLVCNLYSNIGYGININITNIIKL